MRRVAEEMNCEFLDASAVGEPGEDGIHFSEVSHPALGKVIAEKIKGIL